MSTVNVQPTTSARAAVTYALLGTGKRRAQHEKDGTTRAALLSCSLDSPEEIVRRAEQVSAAFHRRNEMYTYTQNFSPEEFDVNNPEHVQRVHELGVKLARRMNSADYLVVTHTDSAGGHLHNHIYVVNHDNLTGKALSRCRSWSRGLRQVNDELMRDEHCQVLPDPQQPKPDWDLRRNGFKDGGFEQCLGDKITEALLDPRSVDREAFEQVLAEHEVRLRITERDGWTYSMRRADNGKWGRRKASSLCDEFTSKGVEEVFVFHQQHNQQNITMKEEQHERARQAQGAAAGLGHVSSLDEPVRSRRGADTGAHTSRERGDRLPQVDGRGAERRAKATEQVDLAAARAALVDAARRRDEQQAQRDRENAERDRRATERVRRGEAERREHREALRSRLVLDDEEARSVPADDDYGLG
ncbi:MAG: relaxase/mobilization nuclease domain-containing protein [Trueperella sp.]|uniref:relaxase/mobilization nuclease domain-containing protein n=1 Tax=Trueperella sp. TaxID=2699835 RepID=UPI0025D1ACE7|nr:relaxase/mobilization nuclease domain-containing protein [Trueperella sp.]MCI7306447.1 relaxase/mobilization nuclease domain-containing protein [Trueperella sp.]